MDDLVQRGDTGTSTNQGDFLELVWLPLPLQDWALEWHGVVDLQVVDVDGHLTTFVGLHQQVERTLLFDVGNWSVRSDDVVALSGDKLGQDGRRNDETGGLVGVWERESVDSCVVRNRLDVGQLEVDPFAVALEDRCHRCCGTALEVVEATGYGGCWNEKLENLGHCVCGR